MKLVLQFFSFCTLLFFGTPVQSQYIIRIAGNDSAGFFGDGGPANRASLNSPSAVCFDNAGNLFICDQNTGSYNALIRKIDATTGIITTIAGNLLMGSGSDNVNDVPSTSVRLRGASCICLDKNGDLLFADGTSCIRKINLTTGLLTTVAGVYGSAGYSGDGGPATAANLDWPVSIAVDAADDIYIVEYKNHVVRKINSATGVISTIAGTGVAGFDGDGGSATAAKFKNPTGICLDINGNIYVADYNNLRVRRIAAASGTISTYAGSGTFGSGGDHGPATAAPLYYPSSVTCDASGNVYVADDLNYSIRKIDVATGIINTYAGNGLYGFLPVDSVGDNGPATAARITPGSMCFDDCGNMFVGSYTCRIRAITPSLPTSGKLCDFLYNSVTDIKETTDFTFSVSPNPAAREILLETKSGSVAPVTIIINDMTGRTIYQLKTQTNKKTKIDLQVSWGLYLATAICENRTITKKIIIE